MELGLRQVSQIRLAALRREEDVALTPEDERLWLACAQEQLPCGIEGNVGAVVVEEIQLDTTRVRPLHEAEVHLPVVGAYELRLRMPVLIYELDPFEAQERQQRRFGLGSRVLPERVADAVPRGCETLFVCVRVLEDQPLLTVAATTENAEADRAAVVLHEIAGARESRLGQQSLHDLRQAVEGVLEVRGIRHVRVAEARVVRGKDMEALRQRRNQVAELVR